MAVLSASYLSYNLQRYVDFKVILPIEDTKTLDPHPKDKPEKFKTLYLLHGHSGSCGDWLYGSRIYKMARDRNIAIVMPSGENSFYVDHDDTGVRYGSYVGNELIEATRRMFPLSDKREDTCVAGLSMGGFGSLLVGSTFAQNFGGIICLSSGFLLDDILSNDKPEYLLGKSQTYFTSIFGDLDKLKGGKNDPLAVATKAQKAGYMPPVYLACGRQDYLFQQNLKMRDDLEAAGISVCWEEDEGEHEWTFWDSYIEKAIDWFLALECK